MKWHSRLSCEQQMHRTLFLCVCGWCLVHWETQYRKVGCGRAVVYQEARHRAAKQGLSCFVSGAPIQTKASGRELPASRIVYDHINKFPTCQHLEDIVTPSL